ncbi:MAG: NAD(+)/NADH kinase [bacterium]|nr:NAD(+)/NADH kinase [bacterium]
MINSVSINFRPNDEDSLPLIKELVELLEKKSIQIMLPDYKIIKYEEISKHIATVSDFVTKADLVIAIGGDGTFLRTARLFLETDQPILGINKGTLGFLTEFNPDEYLKYIEDILDGDFTVAERLVFEAIHFRNGRELNSICFLNDAVLSKGAFSRPIGLELELDGIFINSYSGDGLIIASPTGSTAYSLSAGGPIITPSGSFVYLVNPVCPHSLSTRPIVVPASVELKAKIVSEFKNLLLTIDGQEAIHIEGDDQVLFRLSDKKIRLITHPEKSYYTILKEKLGWG